MAMLRDADAMWLVLDLAIVLAAAIAVALVYMTLRGLGARLAVARGWAALGALMLLVLALVVGLD